MFRVMHNQYSEEAHRPVAFCNIVHYNYNMLCIVMDMHAPKMFTVDQLS